MNVLFLGFGDIARRTARLFVESGWQATGLRRSRETVPDVTMVEGDCRNRALLSELVSAHDLVIASLTPDSFSEEGYREGYVEPALAICECLEPVGDRPKLVLWVSSTSVYGQGEGEWVDESSPTEPKRFSGRALLESEQIILRSPVPAGVIRFSGIYGPGRERMIRQVLAGECAPASPVQWSNRIHADDCAGVLHHLAQLHFSGNALEKIYLGTDCEPVALSDVHQWLATRVGIDVKPSQRKGSRGNRRCSNQRLLATGYEFLYPTFREGYAALLREMIAINQRDGLT